MNIDFDFEGKRFFQFSRQDAIDYGVPVSVFDEAVTAAAWAKLRNERNRRVANCDWTVLADAPLDSSQKAAWKQYRDALRDLPEIILSKNIDPAEALSDITLWPQKPN